MKRVAVLGLLGLVSWSAHADMNAPGWRAGIAASFANFKGDDVPAPELGDGFIDDNSVGFKAYAQYKINDWFGLEGAYHNTGEFEDKSKSLDLPGKLNLSFSGFSAQGLLYVPSPSEDVQLYVKAGFYDFDDELDQNSSTISSSSESGLVGGAGAVIEFSENLGIRADVDWFDAEVGNLFSVNLGIQYRFGGE
ncbi:MAG: outer membrane beta-barrel protein [Gammaproteobacteria bacterium]